MSMQLGLSRFKNTDGISCYMVSILHILQHIPIFTDLLINKTVIVKEHKTVIYELTKIINKILTSNSIKIGPYKFKKIICEMDSMWNDEDQQDSQEFYTFLINKIEDELGNCIIYIPNITKNIDNNNSLNIENIENKSLINIIALNYIHKSEARNYSYIKNLFVGYLISNIKCSLCNTISPSFESFLTLALSIPINKNTNNNTIYRLEECLNLFVNAEKLDKFNKLTCDICGIKNQSIKTFQIWKAPKILVIQLKRFITNAYGIQTTKIVNPITYPVNNFNIIEYIHPESPYKINTIYNLIGINIHKGIINAGHYISIIKNRYNNNWYLYDDDNRPIKIDDNDDLIQNRNAYLLFYLIQ